MQFDDMIRINEIRYQREQQGLALLVAEENALRADLSKLDDHDHRNRATEFDRATAARSLGGDMLWQKWLSKARADINYKLAAVLARKAQHTARVRLAYGKVLVSEKLAADAHTGRQKQRSKLRLEELVEHAVLK